LNQLIESGHQCELMVYPGHGHASFFNFGSMQVELFTRITDFLDQNLLQ
jgi:hypothetical protein